MTPPPAKRRSLFADRLAEFGDFAFGDDAVFSHRGTWQSFFGNRIGSKFDGRIVFEIGCFAGSLIRRMAAKHPTTAFIGLDWKAKSIYDAANDIAADGLKNVALLRGRGQDMASIFAPGEVDEILLFHPDPCALPAELPNRLFGEPFLLAAHSVLKDNGRLTLKTDHPSYYAWALAVLGREEPAHFSEARRRTAADPSLAKRLTGSPRIRAVDLLDPKDRPPHSIPGSAGFDVVSESFDLWNESAAQATATGRVFDGERTGFEERFLKKRQPIYFLDLRKRSSPRRGEGL